MNPKSAALGMAAAAALAGAALSGPAFAAACPTAPVATLSTYLTGGANATCTVLDKTFSGFANRRGCKCDPDRQPDKRARR
jgi:hypothetical protein